MPPLLFSIRAYARMLAVLLWTFATFFCRWILIPVRGVSPAADERIRRGLFSLSCRGTVRITGMRTRFEGSPPEPPYLLVCNHLSFLDIFVLAGRLGCVFVSRGDLAEWPVFGFIARNLGTLFIDRERVRDTARVNSEIQEVLARGPGVVIFPESRIAQGNCVLPFKAALLEPAVLADMPVYWATITYRAENTPGPPEDTFIWKDGVSFFRHYLNVAGLARSEVLVRFGGEPVQGEDRRELATELQRRVTEHFSPVGEREPES